MIFIKIYNKSFIASIGSEVILEKIFFIFDLLSFENSKLVPNTIGVRGFVFFRNLANFMESSILVLQDIDIPNNLKSIEFIKSINLLSEYPKAKKGLTPFFFRWFEDLLAECQWFKIRKNAKFQHGRSTYFDGSVTKSARTQKSITLT